MTHSEAHTKSMLGYLADPANALTLTGFILSGAAVTVAFDGHLDWALALALWAVLADWYDGWLARRTKGRHANVGRVGANLDSFADLVSGGIVPGIIIMRSGNGSLLSCVTAVTVFTAGAIRLSYFNVFGTDDGCFIGMPFPQNLFNVAFIYAFFPLLFADYLHVTLVVTVMVCAILNVSQIRFKRVSKSKLPHATAYVSGLSLFLVLGHHAR